MKHTDSIRITTVVAVDPATAFAVFTDDIGAWWRRDLRHGLQRRPAGILKFEADPVRRLVEENAGGEAFEIGRVRVWQPGERLVFDWRNRDFGPGEKTEVEVRFESIAAGTRVTLEHRGWDALPLDHPARFLGDPAFTTAVGRFWADHLITAWAHARAKHSSR